MAEQYEYAHVSVNTTGLDALVQQLNDFGAEGWELVTTHSVDKTVGLNAVTALIRRAIEPLLAPESIDEAWYPDPTGRFDKRFWNGRAWTFHVARVEDRAATGIHRPSGTRHLESASDPRRRSSGGRDRTGLRGLRGLPAR